VISRTGVTKTVEAGNQSGLFATPCQGAQGDRKFSKGTTCGVGAKEMVRTGARNHKKTIEQENPGMQLRFRGHWGLDGKGGLLIIGSCQVFCDRFRKDDTLKEALGGGKRGGNFSAKIKVPEEKKGKADRKRPLETPQKCGKEGERGGLADVLISR